MPADADILAVVKALAAAREEEQEAERAEGAAHGKTFTAKQRVKELQFVLDELTSPNRSRRREEPTIVDRVRAIVDPRTP